MQNYKLFKLICTVSLKVGYHHQMILLCYRLKIVFGNFRPYKRASGVIMLINPKLRPVVSANSRSLSLSNGYNICSVKLLNCTPQTTLVTVYRPPNVNADDSVALFHDLYAAL